MVRLEIMTREQCHELFRNWENDPDIYMDMSEYRSYEYSAEKVDRYYASKQEPSRRLFAIVVDQEVVGELQLKNINEDSKECTLSIHLQNDSVKEKGYGTQAEILAVEYAFKELKLDAVNADSILKNTRSQHVLQKAGFSFVREDENKRYYIAQK